jgi:hypothetical protein
MGKLKAVAELFEGRHFDREVIILCLRFPRRLDSCAAFRSGIRGGTRGASPACGDGSV